jgi:predicted SnoaL-like aldol condensation-catalyzing enzyme
MKKIVFGISAMLICICFSCNTSPTTGSGMEANSQVQKNLAADSTIGHAFLTGDASMIDSVVAPDFVDHSERGDRNRDSLKLFIKMVHDSFPDMKQELVNQAANDDYVYTWMKFSGNSTGAMGMPKGPYEMRMIEVTKYRDGKATEHWEFTDMRDVAKMMQSMSKMDATKMSK